MNARRRRRIEATLTVLSPLALLLVWELLARSRAIDPRFWPPPSALAETAAELVADGTLPRNLWASLVRIVAGFVLGAVPAVLFGLLMGLWWPARALLMPIAAAVYAIPKISIVPLVMIVLGTGNTGKVAIVAISIFFLVLLSTIGGVLAIDRAYMDVAKNFGAGTLDRIVSVAVPGALPAIFTGLRLGIGFSLVVIVGAEWISSRDGIGRFIFESYQVLAIRDMFVGLLATAILGWLFTLAIDLLERAVVPWSDRA